MPELNGARSVLNFGKLGSVMPMPNLLDVQLRSFQNLVRTNGDSETGWDLGMQAIFKEIFPVSDASGTLELHCVDVTLDEPKYSVAECIERDMTYAAPLKATLRLRRFEGKSKKRFASEVDKENVYLGDLPLLTDLGTFIIKGVERVVVSQLHRSPGVVFEEDVHPNGTKLHRARIIPFRGSWVDFSIDINDVCYVHIDKKKKFPATALLRAFGWSTNEEIYRLFFKAQDTSVPAEGQDERDLVGSVVAADVVDPETGEVLLEVGRELDEDAVRLLQQGGIEKVRIYKSGQRRKGGRPGESPIVKNTLKKDPTSDEEDALRQIYSLLRPGDAPSVRTARTALESVFFDPKRYDLGRVGRYKINQRLGLDDGKRSGSVLCKEDFVDVLKTLIELSEGRGRVDDIDHLGNRRVRTVGELIGAQLSVGLARMAKLIRERMSTSPDPAKIKTKELVNARTVSAVIQAFFGSSQLSQFMDQTNPLAEMTHKRRLSALGPGGLTRERAGFEVRDVHYSHYGRMCPVETPEGPNIGLITSLATYARINDLGFVETPYRKVANGRVTNEIEWLSANDEQEASIAQANAPLDEDGSFRNEYVLCRQKGDFPLLQPPQIGYIDVAPDQLVSVAAALIPFLEHDDANRALMGSNMQRQAVPLLYTDAPLVGTGLEKKVAKDSGAVVVAMRPGLVDAVEADEIVVDTGAVGQHDPDKPLAQLTQLDRYSLKKFRRTNQDTAINQRPLVTVGQRVQPGDVIADGSSTDHGELALGRNLQVAFMPWYGHNFEDAIVLSERLVREDMLTSVHIQELELHVRDTKRGPEEVTREIPNVGDENLGDLDDRGIVNPGAYVEGGGLLCGKITPKGETELSPEEKLLTAIFGEKAKDVKDSSLRMPSGMAGTVIDVKVFSRLNDDELPDKERSPRISELRGEARREIQRITEARDKELKALLHLQLVGICLKRGTVEPRLEEDSKFTKAVLRKLDLSEVDLGTLKVKNDKVNARVRALIKEAKRRIDRIHEFTDDCLTKVFDPDELPPGVLQLVKVYVAEKRKIAVGDKMAGRHGNKGIIARIVPDEDMPYLPDGTPVDVVLNPLGVPSRMNVGQILETHLGWAADKLGFKAKTPVFHGASEDEIALLLKLAGLKWAAESFHAQEEWPFETEHYERFLTLAQAHPAAGRVAAGSPGDSAPAAGNGAGAPAPRIGKSLDEYAGLDVLEGDPLLAQVRRFVVGAAVTVAWRRGRPLDEAFPATAELVRRERQDDGASFDGLEAAVDEFLAKAGLLSTGKVWLRDGRSGQRFESPVTVGTIYMLKLSHLVDDKIHSRSIGPYSLVTQQPLAGKAQFGGQRFGEMEVWALEAYGAAHTLREILTIKSDDVIGRSKTYEAIVKGDNLPKPGVPESFNVLVKELQALGLAVELGEEE